MLAGLTIFLSSFLLFSIQPMFAKRILPMFGGSAAVWTTCLVFYQSALLAGYAYAAVSAKRLGPKWQAMVHIVLLMAAVATLPVETRSSIHFAPVIAILSNLSLGLGLPYFLLSATNPLLQSWLRDAGSRTYRLFALSNAGALAALIAYPAVIEPMLAARAQLRAWSIGFAIFAVICAAVARTRFVDTSVGAARGSACATNKSSRARGEWAALSAAGSMMLLATTNQLTQDVAPVPLLWIVPLAIYLVTFIVAFKNPRWYKREPMLRLLAVALAGVAYAIYNINLSDALIVSIPLFSFALAMACFFCHGELNRRKPETSQLTSFYFMIALGGALGAVFVGLIAPLIFSGIYELPVAMLSVALLALWINWQTAWTQRALWVSVSIAMIVAGVAQARGYHHNAIALVRNFYGSLRVVESNGVRILYHGTVEHGAQFQSLELRKTPTTYYGYESGVGIALGALDRIGPVEAGVIGLGAGTLAAYGRSSDGFRFYEINRQVEQIATRDFSYLKDSAAEISVRIGDARLSLESEAASAHHELDILVVDAFSGDAIPVHLLTREAFELYLQRLVPAGLLAIHVSNQYLDLAPVVGALAQACGLSALEIRSARDDSRHILAADWILLSRDRNFASRLGVHGQAAPFTTEKAWTDDYNNLIRAMRWTSNQ